MAAARESLAQLAWDNAKVDSVFIGWEGHGIITASIMFTGPNWGQGFGGRALTIPAAFQNFILGATKVIGTLTEAKGKICRVGRRRGTGPIVAIRPIIDDGPIFFPGDDLDTRPALFAGEAELP